MKEMKTMEDLYQKKSILQMARGAIQERADYEITKILDNILDKHLLVHCKHHSGNYKLP